MSVTVLPRKRKSQAEFQALMQVLAQLAAQTQQRKQFETTEERLSSEAAAREARLERKFDFEKEGRDYERSQVEAERARREELNSTIATIIGQEGKPRRQPVGVPTGRGGTVMMDVPTGGEFGEADIVSAMLRGGDREAGMERYDKMTEAQKEEADRLAFAAELDDSLAKSYARFGEFGSAAQRESTVTYAGEQEGRAEAERTRLEGIQKQANKAAYEVMLERAPEDMRPQLVDLYDNLPDQASYADAAAKLGLYDPAALSDAKKASNRIAWEMYFEAEGKSVQEAKQLAKQFEDKEFAARDVMTAFRAPKVEGGGGGSATGVTDLIDSYVTAARGADDESLPEAARAAYAMERDRLKAMLPAPLAAEVDAGGGEGGNEGLYEHWRRRGIFAVPESIEAKGRAAAGLVEDVLDTTSLAAEGVGLKDVAGEMAPVADWRPEETATTDFLVEHGDDVGYVGDGGGNDQLLARATKKAYENLQRRGKGAAPDRPGTPGAIKIVRGVGEIDPEEVKREIRILMKSGVGTF